MIAEEMVVFLLLLDRVVGLGLYLSLWEEVRVMRC